jgi:tRNA(fMet)-specific endonuclease VapC
MGLVIDTDVWVLAEKSALPLNLAKYSAHGGAFMSSVTASELLVGVERANTPQRKALRAAFVENLLTHIPVLAFSLPVARTHARLLAALPKNVTTTAHDALIAETAIHHGHHLLTRNAVDFKVFPGLQLQIFEDV